MIEILGLPIVFGILSNLGARFVIWKFPDWSSRKTAIIASLPLPSMVWALCVFVLLDTASSSQESCGVDACGMAMALSMLGIAIGLLGFASGNGGATVAISIAGKRKVRNEGRGQSK